MRPHVAATLLLALSACGKEHPQKDGLYLLTLQTVERDQCELAKESPWSSRLDVAGDLVRMLFGAGELPMTGFFLEKSQRFNLDGSESGLRIRVRGTECEEVLRKVRLESETTSPNTFRANLRLAYESDEPACRCELRGQLDAVLTP